MPRTTSAKKALRQSDTRRVRNVRRKRSLRDALKKLEKALIAKNKIEAEKLYPIAQKAIDKSAKNGILKKNTASRMKSRLSSLLKKLERAWNLAFQHFKVEPWRNESHPHCSNENDSGLNNNK